MSKKIEVPRSFLPHSIALFTRITVRVVQELHSYITTNSTERLATKVSIGKELIPSELIRTELSSQNDEKELLVSSLITLLCIKKK